MVLDVDGQVALARLERDALGDGPARERAVALEAEVVVEPPRVVALHDEDRGLPFRPAPAERLRRRVLPPLALVLPKARHARQHAGGLARASGEGMTRSDRVADLGVWQTEGPV